ncbi:hypothetical protein BC628DRAFT_1335701 [Trametes gibbosa]|nr:hypothetical protein BC628DRAFT_1335701 [Trametes gibbosa]
MGDALFIVDDSNLNSINYETPSLWFPRTNIDSALQGTVTEGLAGAKASLTFSGTALVVFGLATTANDSGPPTVQFSLDGRVVQTTTAPNNGSVNIEFPFLDLENLSSAQHLLELAVVNATQDYPFALDLIAYLPTSGAIPTASQEVVTSFLPAPTSSVAPVAPAKSSGAPVGAIVGGVVGGVALLLVAAFAAYFFCFRRRRKGDPYFYASRAEPGDLLDQEVKATPYEVPPTTPSAFGPSSQYNTGAGVPPSAYSAQSGYPTPLPFNAPTQYAPSEAPGSELSGGTSTSGPSSPPSLFIANPAMLRSSANQARSKAAEAGLLSMPQTATYHADSGIRFSSTGEPSSSSAVTAQVLASPDLADVPPTYSAA